MQREVLLKIIAIELLILAFVKYQIMETEEEGQKETDKEKDKGKAQVETPEEKKTDFYEVITKGKELMKSVKPYLNKRDQYYVEMFTKMAEIVEIQKELFSLSEEEVKAEEEKEPDKIGILKAVKPYISEDKQAIVDKFLKFHEALKNLQEKIEKFSKEEKKANVFGKLVEIYEAIRPLIPEEKVEETDKLARNIKLLEVINKAEGLMNNIKEVKGQTRGEEKKDFESEVEEEKVKEEIENSDGEEEIKGKPDEEKVEEEGETEEEKALEGLSEQQKAVIDNLKSMLTKEQQQYMYNMINYLKHHKLKNLEDNKEGE